MRAPGISKRVLSTGAFTIVRALHKSFIQEDATGCPVELSRSQLCSYKRETAPRDKPWHLFRRSMRKNLILPEMDQAGSELLPPNT